MDVSVVGGGIFGVTAALALRQRGADVTLIDPGSLPHPNASSTDISKAVRADYGDDAGYTAMMEQAFVGWRDWNERFERPLYHQTGMMFLSSVPLAPGSFEHDSYTLLRQRGHALERLDAAAITQRFPVWRSGHFVDGYFNPVAGWAESGAVVAALLQRAQRLGVVVRHERFEATREGSTVTVVACGAWTSKLLPELSDRLSSVAQSVLHFRPRDPALFRPPQLSPWAADIARRGWYGFCLNADGVVKVAHHGAGQVVDPDGERRVPDGVEAKFRTFLREAMPALAEAPCVQRRVCLYSDSFDGDFLIDHHPNRRNVIVASGGSGHAFKFAPLLGDIIADVVENKPNPWARRFRWRERAERRHERARFDER